MSTHNPVPQHYSLHLYRHYPLAIQQFSTHHLLLSQDYLLDVGCHLEDYPTVDLQACLNQPAHIQINNTIQFHAWVSALSQQKTHLQVSLSSPLWPLKLNQRARVFRARSLADIIITIFKPYPIQRQQLDLPKQLNNIIIPLAIQHEQSDFDFLCHLLRQYQLFFFIQQHQPAWQLVITSHIPKTQQTITLDYQPASGQLQTKPAILSQGKHYQWLADSVECQHYYYLQPQTLIHAQAKTQTHNAAKTTIIQDCYQLTSSMQAQQMATQWQTALDCQRQQLLLTTNNAKLSLADTIQFNGTLYYIIEIKHHYHFNHYYNYLTLLPIAQVYAPTPPLSCQAPPGLLHASISQTTALNQHADYVINYAFFKPQDLVARRLFDFTGQQQHGVYGYHHPLANNTPIVCLPLQDDINQPLILGALVTARRASPVRHFNFHHYCFISKQQQAWHCSDDTKNPFFSIQHRNAHITLKHQPQVIDICHRIGDIALFSGADTRLSCLGHCSYHAKDLRHECHQHYLHLSLQHAIHYHAKNTIGFHSSQQWQLSTQHWHSHSKRQITLLSQQTLSISANTMIWQCKQGPLNIEGNTLQLSASHQLSLQSGNQSLSLNPQGISGKLTQLTLNANNIIVPKSAKLP